MRNQRWLGVAPAGPHRKGRCATVNRYELRPALLNQLTARSAARAGRVGPAPALPSMRR